MLLKYTLDTNCIISLDESREDSAYIKKLVEAHSVGCVSVGIVAASASENQKSGKQIDNFEVFLSRIEGLGLGNLEILPTLCYYDISFYDYSIFCEDEMLLVEKIIHSILFPKISYQWDDYCKQNDVSNESIKILPKWRNAKCDVLAYWTHVYHKRDVFVTSDRNFHLHDKKSKLLSLYGGHIETPERAVLLVNQSTGMRQH